MRKVFATLLLLAAVGCGDKGPTEPPIPVLTGGWQGNTGGATVTMTLSAAGPSLSGSGNLSGAGGALALQITGTHAHPSVSLTFTAPGYQPLNFQGTMQGDRSIVGTLSGSGYNNDPITFHRQ